MRKNKNNIGLLPFIREDIYGASLDSHQAQGWEIQKLNIASQWGLSMGEGVKIAVIDTGCDLDHPDLKNNLLQGKNFIEVGKDPIDKNGHGTHVSGTIAAENNSIGMVGIAPKAKIVPVKALNDQGAGSWDSIVNAIMWAADCGVDFITMSLGSPSTNISLERAINYAASKGVIIFCAAGNEGAKSDIMYPARYEHTISIGAIDENLERTSFTCSGETLDFLAPGHNILSCVPDNSYALMSGTSMSNPFAVGLASLLCGYAKSHGFSGLPNRLKTTEDYIDIFKTKAKDLTNPEFKGIKKYQGYGIMYPVL